MNLSSSARVKAVVASACVLLVGCSEAVLNPVEDIDRIDDVDEHGSTEIPTFEVDVITVDDSADTRETGIVQVDVTNDTGVHLRGFLEPCAEDRECEAGFCVADAGKTVCSRFCKADCPQGWTCLQVEGANGDKPFVCASLAWALCRPCHDDKDCRSGALIDACVIYSDEGQFCGQSCAGETKCPDGYECRAMPTTAVAQSMQCVRVDRLCECTDAYILDGLSTTCRSTNKFGSCSGERTCSLEGLTPCNARYPEEETCNRNDDDCDGQTDEGLGDCCRCGNGECEWACGETLELCPNDCKVCGDAYCSPSESPANCPADCCGWCGDSTCMAGFPCGEDQTTCPSDCGMACGNKTCDKGENPINCEEDCKWKVCGNGLCEGGEGLDDTNPCPADCDKYCGNCKCEGGESLMTCPTDCGSCGDGVCSPCEALLETHETCPKDCCDVKAVEECNFFDDDCDGKTDEEGADGCSSYFLDEDVDGYGVESDQKCLCGPSTPYVATKTGDCLDNDPTVNPAATEVCNGKDDDCDGKTDPEDTPGCVAYYRDSDGDSHGDPKQTRCLCGPEGGYVAQAGDCADDDKEVYPGQVEACNGKDDNCNDAVDEGEGLSGCKVFLLDSDGDGYGLDDVTKCLCSASGKYTATKGGDCLDGDWTANPAATEVCNGKDDDCNGQMDDGDLCDDGVSCTANECKGAAGCSYPLNEGWCLIGGTCYLDGQADPTNACQTCVTTESTTVWTNVTDGTECQAASCLGLVRSLPKTCLAGMCLVGGEAVSCDDGRTCTTDSCDPLSGCTNSLQDGKCLIGDTCYTDGQPRLENVCQVCRPASDPTAWTPLSDGTQCIAPSCEGLDWIAPGKCWVGQCNAGATQNCDDALDCTSDNCSSLDGCRNTLNPGRCLIAGKCFQEGNPNPDNRCEVCTTANGVSDWTMLPDWAPCQASSCEGLEWITSRFCSSGNCTLGGLRIPCNDGKDCTLDACQAAEGCSNLTIEGYCYIDGNCYGESQSHPTSACLICTTGSSTSAWSNADDGVQCLKSACAGLHWIAPKTCAAGACTGGGAVVPCDDVQPCTMDECSEMEGCFHENGIDGASCGGAATCQTGRCYCGGVLGLLGTSRTYVSGAGSRSVAIGDLDGDGTPDLAVANERSGPYTVSVLLNSGNGTYYPKVDYGVGQEPKSVAIGDLNGDGKPDLMVANGGLGSNSVSVLLNNGNGTFAAKVDYGTGSLPYSVATGDLNGDGLPDLAVANGGSTNTVSVLLNTGNGTLAAKVDHGTGSYPRSVAIGDLDGDGTPDLAVAGSGSDTVSVLLNNGNATFAEKADYGTGTDPFSVAIGDLNADGKPDLAVANSGSDTVSVLLNNGNGTFAAKVDFSTGADPRSIAIGDLDGDGKPDLAVANSGSGTTSVLMSFGNGTFATKVDYGTGSSPYSVAINDLDGDGELDLAVANSGNSTVTVLLNNGNGTFPTKLDLGTGSGPISVAIGDLNGDWKPDLVVANWSHSVSVLLNNGNGVFAATVNYESLSYPRSVAVGDLDGDGKPDIAAANNGSDTVSVRLNIGNGTFSAITYYYTGSDPESVAIGDVNVDGKPDLAVANRGTDKVSVLLNNGSGTFATKVDYVIGSSPRSVAIDDFNGDGKPDMAVAIGKSVSVLLNLDGSSFADKVDYGTGLEGRSVASGDLNGDGKPDLAVANRGSATVSVLLNNGHGTFAEKADYVTGSNPYSVAIGDLNGDGKSDLAVAGHDSDTVSVLLNNGNGTFAEKADYVTGSDPFSLAIGDLNADGKPDLAVANYGPDTVSVLLNDCLVVPACGDSNPCTTDAWDSLAQICTHTPVANGTPCGSAATCQSGKCG